MSRKGFAPIIILAIVAVAIIAGGIWFATHRGVAVAPGSNPASDTTVTSSITIEPSSTSRGAGAFCGGIATGAFPCDPGYSCQLNGTYPDAGGHCVKN